MRNTGTGSWDISLPYGYRRASVLESKLLSDLVVYTVYFFQNGIYGYTRAQASGPKKFSETLGNNRLKNAFTYKKNHKKIEQSY